MKFILGRNIFQTFLNKPMQRKSDFQGSNSFSKTPYMVCPYGIRQFQA